MNCEDGNTGGGLICSPLEQLNSDGSSCECRPGFVSNGGICECSHPQEMLNSNFDCIMMPLHCGDLSQGLSRQNKEN